MPEATHPLVRTHPETHRKSLYLNPNRMERIVGLAQEESDRLLDELIAHDDRAPGPEALRRALVFFLEGFHLRRDVLAEAAAPLEVEDHGFLH